MKESKEVKNAGPVIVPLLKLELLPDEARVIQVAVSGLPLALKDPLHRAAISVMDKISKGARECYAQQAKAEPKPPGKVDNEKKNP